MLITTDKEKKAIDLLNYYTGQYINCPVEDEEWDCCREEAEKTLLNLIEKQQEELELKDKVIDEIKEEVRNHTSFENYLKRQDKESDLFNQGRFYVADNIKEILNKVKENKE